MKVTVCDMHAAEGKLVPCKWNLTLKRGFEKIKVQVCAEHEKAVKTYQQGLDILAAASSQRMRGI